MATRRGASSSVTEQEWPEWDFDKHCTGAKPQFLKMEDLGYKGNEKFAVTLPFQVFTPAAIKLCKDIMATDEKVKKHCNFARWSYNLADNSSILRNVTGINKFFHTMFKCKRFEAYLREMTGAPIEFWNLTWYTGHINIQHTRNGLDKPNVEWHKDNALNTILVNLSDMPENPDGGGTLVKRADGTDQEIMYKHIGDSIVIAGHQLMHCGMPAKNYNKVILAAGLGSTDVTVHDPGNDFNEQNMQMCDPVNFMKQWTEYRLERISRQLELLIDDKEDVDKQALLENMRKENGIMKSAYGLFHGHLESQNENPWLP